MYISTISLKIKGVDERGMKKRVGKFARIDRKMSISLESDFLGRYDGTMIKEECKGGRRREKGVKELEK